MSPNVHAHQLGRLPTIVLFVLLPFFSFRLGPEVRQLKCPIAEGGSEVAHESESKRQRKIEKTRSGSELRVNVERN